MDVTATVVTSPASNHNVPWHNVNVAHIGVLSAGATFTGFNAPIVTELVDVLVDGALDGKVVRRALTIFNRSGQTLTFTHQDVGSLAANRIITGSGASPGAATVNDGGVIELLYNPIDARWAIIAIR